MINGGMLWESLSFADGSSARVSAINQSLRHYRPSYMHFWQLKTFWCENKLCFDDVESHFFEEISTEPAICVDQTTAPVKMIVSAMQQFRSEFERIMSGESTTRIWLLSGCVKQKNPSWPFCWYKNLVVPQGFIVVPIWRLACPLGACVCGEKCYWLCTS